MPRLSDNFLLFDRFGPVCDLWWPHGQDEKQIRIVQLHEILDAASERPSYGKLLDRLSFFLNRENDDSWALKLCYKLGKEEIVVGSSIELEYAIRCLCQSQYQSGHKNDYMSMVAMSATVVQQGSKRATSSPVTAPTVIMEAAGTTSTTTNKSQLPANLVHYDRVQFPTVRFDTSCDLEGVLEGVMVSHQGRCITQIVEPGVVHVYKPVYAQEGFASGSHYWSYRILDHGCVKSSICIGVGSAKVNKGHFPGIGNHPGCSLAVRAGRYWKANVASGVPDVTRVNEATTIGVLLDMDHKTVTFYADGKRVGMGAGADMLKAKTYYPVVSFCHLGQSVVVEDSVHSPH
jgi:hypothetical protein